MGMVYPGHGHPSVEEMIVVLRAISASFTTSNWNFEDWEEYYIVKFSSPEGLTHTFSRTSISCKYFKAISKYIIDRAMRTTSSICSQLQLG